MPSPELIWAELTGALSRIDSLETSLNASAISDADPFFNMDPGTGSFQQEDISNFLNQPFRVQGIAELTSAAAQNYFNVRLGEVIVGGLTYTRQTSFTDTLSTDVTKVTDMTDYKKFMQFQPSLADMKIGSDANVIDIWVEIDFKSNVWRFRGKGRADVSKEEWTSTEFSVVDDVTMAIIPIASVHGILNDDGAAFVNPLNIVQHHVGNIELSPPGFADPQSPVYFGPYSDTPGDRKVGNLQVKVHWRANVHRYHTLTEAENDGIGSGDKMYFRNRTYSGDDSLNIFDPEPGTRQLWAVCRDVLGADPTMEVKEFPLTGYAEETESEPPDDLRSPADDKWEWWEKIADYKAGTATNSVVTKIISEFRFNVNSLVFFDRRHPDGEAGGSGPNRQRSINFSTTAGASGAKGLLQLYQFDQSAVHTPDFGVDQMVMRIGSGSDRTIKYSTLEEIGNEIAYNTFGLYASNFWALYGHFGGAINIYGYGVNAYGPYAHNEHTRLDFTNSNPASNSKSENTDHDLRYLYSANHSTNIRGLSTTGDIKAGKLLLQTAGNAWDASDLHVTTTSDISLVAEGGASIIAGSNINMIPTGAFRINGVPGADAGTLTFSGGETLTFKKGILTGSSGF